MSRLTSFLSYLLGSFCVVIICGCGGEKVTLYPVEGTVEFKEGGPVPTGTVEFSSDKHTALAAIQSDGTFKLGNEKEGFGVPAGEYKVAVSAATNEEDYRKVKQLVDTKFSNREESDLRFTVEPKTNQFKIVVGKAKTN
jgi:hypothetical protein